MTSHERVLRAITFTGPDRVPIHHAVFPDAYERHGPAPIRALPAGLAERVRSQP
jgi:hypothetical protein